MLFRNQRGGGDDHAGGVAALLEDAQVEDRQDGQQMVEDIRLDFFIDGPAGVIGETVDFKWNTGGSGLELAHQQRYEEVATDAGYESLDNYLYLEANGQMSFIKPTNGKRNIRIELFFLALGFNLKKRWMKQQKSRLETHYSEKKAS